MHDQKQTKILQQSVGVISSIIVKNSKYKNRQIQKNRQNLESL